MLVEETCTILIVDDTTANLDILIDTLENDYQIIVAVNGRSAIKQATDQLPDLILLDIMMPDMDGFEVCGYLKNSEATESIPIIFLSALNQLNSKTRAFEIGAADYITKPFEIAEVRARVTTQLRLISAKKNLENQNLFLEEKVKERTRDLLESERDLILTQEVTINCMANLAESRDPETGDHIKRTQNYIKLLAGCLKNEGIYEHLIDDFFIENIFQTSPLHDIGKVGIPDHILLKPGKLTKKEFNEMKKHTIYGLKALRSAEEKLGTNSFLGIAEEITYCHHEKWDGTGYPKGLKGENIPLSGRLMALVDVYDALINERVYKPAYTHEKAYEIILAGKGSHFDPSIVEIFEKVHTQFHEIATIFDDQDS